MTDWKNLLKDVDWDSKQGAKLWEDIVAYMDDGLEDIYELME